MAARQEQDSDSSSLKIPKRPTGASALFVLDATKAVVSRSGQYQSVVAEWWSGYADDAQSTVGQC